MFKQILMMCCLGVLLSACSGSGGSSGAVSGNGAAAARGVWIKKNEAEELRSTGRLDSLCPELRTSPGRRILNVRLVDESGALYAYSPLIGKTEKLRLGVIGDEGSLAPSPMLRELIGDARARVEIAGEAMSVIFGAGSSPMRMAYLRSSEDEVRRYYEAQERCR